MTARLTLSVDVYKNDQRIDTIDGAPVSYTGETIMPNQEYRAILGDAHAKTSISVSAKISGPERSYSSVQVHASVALDCNQDEATVELASGLATSAALRALEDALPMAQSLLVKVLNKGWDDVQR